LSWVRHLKTDTPSYKSWEMMIQRCTNPNFDGYFRYGGRGIKVCEEWRDFINFHNDMGDRPEGMSLDRVDVDGDYCKENCKWSNQTDQLYNKRKSDKNTSGRTGVYWHKGASKWAASITYKGRQHHLGLFESFDCAVSARESAELKFYGKVRKD